MHSEQISPRLNEGFSEISETERKIVGGRFIYKDYNSFYKYSALDVIFNSDHSGIMLLYDVYYIVNFRKERICRNFTWIIETPNCIKVKYLEGDIDNFIIEGDNLLNVDTLFERNNV